MKLVKFMFITSVKQVFSSHQLDDPEQLGDYCDAEQFKSREIFQEDPNALQICFYYDDLEVCNPLGSKAKIHKLGCYTIFVHTCTIIHDTLSV